MQKTFDYKAMNRNFTCKTGNHQDGRKIQKNLLKMDRNYRKAKDAKEPVLLDNPRFVRTFETITDSQGFPKKGELDPTPMIAIMWPIFYGIMFADLGHGLLLMGMGLLFKVKGQGNMARWGMLIAISGAAAAMAGMGTGEVFGSI